MRYATKWIELTYDGSFRNPLFDLVRNPVDVIEAIHKRLSTKYHVPLTDMSTCSGSKLSDFHARIVLFSGNGTIDVRADGFNAKFINARSEQDSEAVKDCLLMTSEALSELNASEVAYGRETVSLRMFAELLDEPFDGPIFLRSLFANSALFENESAQESHEIVPGFQVEFLNESQKWMCSFNVSRAHRSRKELFVLINANYDEGNPFPTMDQKASHLRTLLEIALVRAQLQPTDPTGE